MNRLLQTVMVAALVLSAVTWVSCDNFDFDKASGETLRNELRQQYAEAFLNEFGSYGRLEIDKNHLWGFEYVTPRSMPAGEEVLSDSIQAPSDSIDASADTTEVLFYRRTAADMPAQYASSWPERLTQSEKDYVLEYIRNNPNEEPMRFDYSDYFIQYVGTTYDPYVLTDTLGESHEVKCGLMMKDLAIGGQLIPDHSAAWGPDLLVLNLPFADPTYYDRFSNTTFNEGWRIYCISGYGYYLCFDYRTRIDALGLRYEGDGICNDWVVKLVPAGEDKGDQSIRRVMAEDYAQMGDFDYNDVVFDVDYLSDGRVKITVHAVGTNVPVRVADREVHELFGVTTDVKVNVGVYAPEGLATTARSFVVTPSSTNPLDIPVVSFLGDGVTMGIEARLGEAPGKICVPATTSWMREGVNIKQGYPRFVRWITDRGNTSWPTSAVADYLY